MIRNGIKMKTKKTSADKTVLVLFSIFAAIGVILFLIGSIFLYNGLKFMKHAQKTTAIISDIERTRSSSSRRNSSGTSYRVYVSYEIDGVAYESVPIAFYSSNMHIGKEITIYYHEDNPYNIKVRSETTFIVLILYAIGTVFGIIGFCGVIAIFKQHLKNKQLLKNGRLCSAQITAVLENYSVTTNGKHPFYIECKVIDQLTGEEYLYKSDDIQMDPTPYLDTNVPVYVNPTNPAEYYVDTDSIFLNGDKIIHDFR